MTYNIESAHLWRLVDFFGTNGERPFHYPLSRNARHRTRGFRPKISRKFNDRLTAVRSKWRVRRGFHSTPSTRPGAKPSWL